MSCMLLGIVLLKLHLKIYNFYLLQRVLKKLQSEPSSEDISEAKKTDLSSVSSTEVMTSGQASGDTPSPDQMSTSEATGDDSGQGDTQTSDEYCVDKDKEEGTPQTFS